MYRDMSIDVSKLSDLIVISCRFLFPISIFVCDFVARGGFILFDGYLGYLSQVVSSFYSISLPPDPYYRRFGRGLSRSYVVGLCHLSVGDLERGPSYLSTFPYLR